MEKKIQEKYFILQLLSQQRMQIQQQIQVFEKQMSELEYVRQSLDDISAVEEGTDILGPLSSEIFIRASLKDSENLLVNVGGGVTLKKDVAGVKDLIDSQAKEVVEMKDELQGHIETIQKEASKTEAEIQKLSKNVQVSKG